MKTRRRDVASGLRALALLAGLALLTACDDGEGWVVPGPSTARTVTLPYPEFYRQFGFDEPIVFGAGSADLKLVVVGQEDHASTRVLDLAHPGRSLLRGYGRFSGLHEVHRRSRMVDDHGIHGVRAAVYRKNEDGLHTNVLYQHIARDVAGDLFTTSFAHWDWQGGEEDLTVLSVAAYPMRPGLQMTHYFEDVAIGLTPSSWADLVLVRTVFLSTDARAPTAGIDGCVLYLFNHFDPDRRYLAYFHEDFGLVEIVYEWESAYDFDQTDWLYSILPRSGFALAEEPVEQPAPRLETEHHFAGRWHGALQAFRDSTEHREEPTVFREHRITLTVEPNGQHYSPVTGSHTLRATYDDDRIQGLELVGHVVPTQNEIRFTSARSTHIVVLTIDTSDHARNSSNGLWIRNFQRVLDVRSSDPDRAIRNVDGVLHREGVNP